MQQFANKYTKYTLTGGALVLGGIVWLKRRQIEQYVLSFQKEKKTLYDIYGNPWFKSGKSFHKSFMTSDRSESLRFGFLNVMTSYSDLLQPDGLKSKDRTQVQIDTFFGKSSPLHNNQQFPLAPDVLGMCEVSYDQLQTYLSVSNYGIVGMCTGTLHKSIDEIGPNSVSNYGIVGMCTGTLHKSIDEIGPNDHINEILVLMYNKDKFTLRHRPSYYELPDGEWHARGVLEVQLVDSKTQKVYVMYVSHLDSISTKSREQSFKIINDRMQILKKTGCTPILLFDSNNFPDEAPEQYSAILNNNFTSALSKTNHFGPWGTFNGGATTSDKFTPNMGMLFREGPRLDTIVYPEKDLTVVRTAHIPLPMTEYLRKDMAIQPIISSASNKLFLASDHSFVMMDVIR
jgi:hypothetical protein